MNYWTKTSIELANQKNYLDMLYRVYPICPNLRRDIDAKLWNDIEHAYKCKKNEELIKLLIRLKLFPIKDSYVAYLRRDPTAIDRNPMTVNRIAGELYDMGLDEMYDNCTQPKETNRQIGPMFKEWLSKGTLGAKVFTDSLEFWNSTENGVLNVNDEEMKNYASLYLGYEKNKGLDFIARFNNNYVIGETKFITDFGGHQDRQFDDAVSTAQVELKGGLLKDVIVKKIAIVDGVIYIPGNHHYAKYFNSHPDVTILSSLLLRDYLYSL